jgi:hypothetical protein
MIKTVKTPYHIARLEEAEWINYQMKEKIWSIKYGLNLYKFPYWMLDKVYSKSNLVLRDGRYVKGKIVYLIISSVYTVDNIPIIVDVIVDYNQLPLLDTAVYMSYSELKKVFTNNKFED